ncbi:translation initiation factor IF-1 [bacterium]|nr:translation initiation factor IF-1 [bacterium]
MAKETALEFDGKVVEVLPGSRFKIELENGHLIMGTLSGRMRKNNIKVILYDRVTVEMTPYDLTMGRITFRHK